MPILPRYVLPTLPRVLRVVNVPICRRAVFDSLDIFTLESLSFRKSYLLLASFSVRSISPMCITGLPFFPFFLFITHLCFVYRSHVLFLFLFVFFNLNIRIFVLHLGDEVLLRFMPFVAP